MPSLDSERPFDRWNNDLNVFTAGGAADGDGSRQADLKGFASTGMPAVLDRERRRLESVDGRTVAQPKPRQNGRVCKRRGGLFCCLSIFSYVSPPADMVNVDVRENIPMVCFVGLSAGGKSLVAWREPHGQP